MSRDELNAQMVTKGEKIQSLVSYITHLSEAIFNGSYNSDDIRKYWNHGQLDQVIRDRSAIPVFNITQKLQNAEIYREDGLYSDTVSSLVDAVDGWPVQCSILQEDLAPLTRAEYLLLIDYHMKSF